MALDIRNILNGSPAFDGSTSSSQATQPPSLTSEPSPGASSCPQSPYTPTDLSSTAPGQAVPAKRPLEDGTTEDVRPQYRNLHPLTGVPTGPPSAMSGLGRLHSQPPIASPRMQAPLSTLPLSYAPCHPRPPLVHSQISSSPNKRAGRPLPGPRPSSETATPRSETRRGYGIGGSLFGVDGQQAFLALPGNQTHIPVQMEFSQASKKADEKRQRNAVASTRHRLKKKNMEAERAKQLQEITQERDFYREECNRLRDIIAQTPSISYHAAGPPSPTISTSNSYAGPGH